MKPILVLFLLFLLAACTAESAPNGSESAFAPLVQGGDGQAAPAEAYPAPAEAGGANADVEFVSATRRDDGTWTFTVTVAHPDTGWEDYADGWDVVLPDGAIAKPDPDSPFTRLLLHPHETEQPFTRSQTAIVIPEGVTAVTVRAHDLVDGFGGREVVVDLTAASGPGFEVTGTP